MQIFGVMPTLSSYKTTLEQQSNGETLDVEYLPAFG